MQQPYLSLQSLRGEELNAVCFVMDYVEFHFNGPILRALTDPRVQTGEQSSPSPAPSSRDELCALIGLTVEGIDVMEGDTIRVRLTSGRVLVVPLVPKAESLEAAHFVPGQNKPIQVW